MSDAFKDAGPGERSVYDRTGLPEVAAIARMAAMSDEELIARLRLGPEYVYRFVDTDHVAADRIAALTAQVAELEACLERQVSGHREDLDEIANVSVQRLRRAEAAEAERDYTHGTNEVLLAENQRIEAERDALRAQVAQMKEDFPNGI